MVKLLECCITILSYRRTLTPARRIWEEQSQNTQQHGRRNLHSKRNAPLSITVSKGSSVPDPVCGAEPKSIEQSFQTDKKTSVFRRRQLGKVYRRRGIHHADGESGECATKNHHDGIHGGGLKNSSHDAKTRADEECPASRELVHGPGCSRTSQGITSVVTRDNTALQRRVIHCWAIHIQLESLLGNRGRDDTRVDTVDESGESVRCQEVSAKLCPTHPARLIAKLIKSVLVELPRWPAVLLNIFATLHSACLQGQDRGKTRR
jgi:hypothetical protein